MRQNTFDHTGRLIALLVGCPQHPRMQPRKIANLAQRGVEWNYSQQRVHKDAKPLSGRTTARDPRVFDAHRAEIELLWTARARLLSARICLGPLGRSHNR